MISCLGSRLALTLSCLRGGMGEERAKEGVGGLEDEC